jgi:epoxyqueuosine reductase QueG
MINKTRLTKVAVDYMEQSEANWIRPGNDWPIGLGGFKLFDAPLFAFGSADDDMFAHLKQPTVIGQHLMLPRDWLPSAETVISYFLPFSEAVKRGNSRDMSWPSTEWLYARVEGQLLINRFGEHMKTMLADAGYKSVIPSLDSRFWSHSGGSDSQGPFTSNWSERHVAYICGLGTFGLSKGLITAKGIAGRFGSIVTELSVPPDPRQYDAVYEYCNLCGQCAKNCPAQAITLENGKDHKRCSMFLNIIKEKTTPRFGCGKCQVNVPCESGIPTQIPCEERDAMGTF